MEAALLAGERTDLVSTNRLGHGWAHQKLANQQATFWAGCNDGCDWLPADELAAMMAVIGCHPRSCSRFVETKAVRWTQWLKGLTLSPYYLSSWIAIILIRLLLKLNSIHCIDSTGFWVSETLFSELFTLTTPSQQASCCLSHTFLAIDMIVINTNATENASSYNLILIISYLSGSFFQGYSFLEMIIYFSSRINLIYFCKIRFNGNKDLLGSMEIN